MELLCSGQLRELYSDHSLDKRGRDARMFTIRDDVILKLRELKPTWDPVVLNEVNVLLYSISRWLLLNVDPDPAFGLYAGPDRDPGLT